MGICFSMCVSSGTFPLYSSGDNFINVHNIAAKNDKHMNMSHSLGVLI